MPEQVKRLFRSTRHKMIGGVCGGIAEYLNIDPTIVRIGWIVLSFFPLIPGILVYIIAWIVIPKQPVVAGDSQPTSSPRESTATLFGFFFIAFGVLILLVNLDVFRWYHWWDFSWNYAVPALLIGAGVFFLVRPAVGKSGGAASESSPKQDEPRSGQKKLRRSSTERKVFGVCGGIAEYFDIDPSLVRIAFVLFSLWPFGLGVVAYVLLALVMPEVDASPQPQS